MSKSRNRNRQGRPERLSPGAADVLLAGLQAIKNAPSHAHDRRVERMAVSYRPCKRGSDFLPEARTEFDAFRMMTLSNRHCDRSGVVTRITVLGAYKPVVDLPGTGRIVFRAEGALTIGKLGGRLVPDPRVNLSGCRTAVLMAQEVEDADQVELAPGIEFPEFYFAFDPWAPPVFEGPMTVEDWLAAEVKIGNLRAWPAAYFARPQGARHDVHPIDGSADPFALVGDAAPGGTIRGSWVLRDGVATPMAQEPREILVSFDGLRGRSVRSPAIHALRSRRVLNPHRSFRDWLERIAPYTGTGRNAPDPLDPATEAGRFRARLAEAVDRDGHEALLQGVRDSCQAAEVPIPVDQEEAYAFLTGLLEDPWLRPEVPGVAAIQRVRLTGPPDPSTMTFSNGVVEADLYDLGIYTEQYAQLPAGRVAEALAQNRRGHKGARPWRRATI